MSLDGPWTDPGKTRKDQERRRPGGMRGGTEPPVGSSGRDFFCFVLLTRLSPDKGLAVFKRYVHSAGPD